MPRLRGGPGGGGKAGGGKKTADRIRRAAEALRARPADEPLRDALAQVVPAGFEQSGRSPDPAWAAGVRLLPAEPALPAEMVKAGAAAGGDFAAAVAARTGTDAETGLYPGLVAAAVPAAQQTAADRWLRADPPVPLLPLVREALGLLAAGLPDPPAGRTAGQHPPGRPRPSVAGLARARGGPSHALGTP